MAIEFKRRYGTNDSLGICRRVQRDGPLCVVVLGSIWRIGECRSITVLQLVAFCTAILVEDNSPPRYRQSR